MEDDFIIKEEDGLDELQKCDIGIVVNDFGIIEENGHNEWHKCDQTNIASFTNQDVKDIKVKFEPLVTQETDDSLYEEDVFESVHKTGDDYQDSCVNLNKFECAICGMKFSIIDKAQLHLRLCAMKQIKCKMKAKLPICGSTREKSLEHVIYDKKFIKNNNLGDHTRIHSEERLFECKVCEKKFVRYNYLEMHTRSHNTDDKHKPFECTICRKKYAYNGHLQNHMKIHI